METVDEFSHDDVSDSNKKFCDEDGYRSINQDLNESKIYLVEQHPNNFKTVLGVQVSE